MFERFTDRARRALVIAQNDARSLGHRFIRPEHLLLGLSKVEGLASTAMHQAGVDDDGLRDRVASAFPSMFEARKADKVPFSPEAKKSLEMALREALRLGHNYIGTEHLLLGVLDQADADVSKVGEVLGLPVTQVEARIRSLVSGSNDRQWLVSGAKDDDSTLSPALGEAMRLAQEHSDGAPVTTGHLLEAMLADPSCQVGKALDGLGITQQSIKHALAVVPISATSDVVAAPSPLELRFGERSIAIEDREVVAALSSVTPERLRALLRQAFGFEAAPGGSVEG
jgi:ATP-dependent Clp protease ATP-binding subunit ClpA